MAFITDVFARCIVGWRVNRSLDTDWVWNSIETSTMDVARNQWVNPSQRSWQSISVNSLYGTLAEANIDTSVGTVGDSYDNALAETINGLYKTEVIRHRGPWRNIDEVEFATLE